MLKPFANAVDDKFKNATVRKIPYKVRASVAAGYVGKTYANNRTEVFSMGMEQLYKDPINFAEDDPEYFKFIVGVLRGDI